MQLYRVRRTKHGVTLATVYGFSKIRDFRAYVICNVYKSKSQSNFKTWLRISG
jgi:hypothetical protein